MESNRKTTKRKGLTSLIALLLCAAMLVAGTYAWFTDTATVKGNKVNAGNLYVDVVATEEEIKEAKAMELKGVKYDDVDPSEQSDVDDAVEEFINSLPSTAKTTKGGVDYYTVTDKELSIMTLVDVEPNSTWPVKVNVKNSGDLAISFSAGFSVDVKSNKKQSFTGLETLKNQIGTKYSSDSDPEYVFRKGKLEAMQVGIDPATGKRYTSYTAGTAPQDMGEHLENVLEVYAMTADEFDASYADEDPQIAAQAGASMELLKEDKADGTKANYIGTIQQIMDCNNAATMKAKEDAIKAATDDDTKAELQAEYNELVAVKGRLAAASKGYCLTTKQLDGAPTKEVTIYGRDGLPLKDGQDENIVMTGVSEIGTAYFAIHMPGEADNLYQNASISLGVGVTATQVEYETDGINVMIYDNAEARTPAPTTTPEPSPAP